MAGPTVDCPHCGVPLPENDVNSGVMAPCPTCRLWVEAYAFPASIRPFGQGNRGQAVVIDEESSCFYHPKKRAETPCEHCGRFLCSLCAVDIAGKPYCSACIAAGAHAGGQLAETREFIRYDIVALWIALLPLIFLFPTIITAPVAIYFAVRHWSAPMGLLKRPRWRSLVAILVSCVTLLGWVFFFLGIAADARNS